MAGSHVVSGLVAKRGELAGEVEHYRRELHRLAEALGQVDATIRLFDPNYDLGAIAVSKRGGHQWFGAGECQAWSWNPCAMPSSRCRLAPLARALVARKGLEDSREVVAAVQKTAAAVLRRLVAEGVVHRQALANGTQVWECG